MARLLLLLLLLPAVAAAQTSRAGTAARQWRQQHERAIVDELVTLLRLPNVSRNAEDVQKNAQQVLTMLLRRGITAQLVAVPGGSPVVAGEIRTPGATRTIGLYAHYDGQPVDPKEWTNPPFEPTLRTRRIEEGGTVVPLPPAGTSFDPESRLYARAASDDKAPIVAMLAAVDALRAANVPLTSNIRFAFEGEEEINSPSLEKTIAANRSLFAADLWIVCDGPVYQTRQQSVIFGARGITPFELTVYGPRIELHSGQYGNWAPNPALELARLLAAMKSAAGRVVIPHFYDEVAPLGPLEKRAIAAAPAVEAQLRRDFALGTSDEAPRGLYDLLAQPSLNIRGMAASRVGTQAANVIPSSATASLDIRMVKGMTVARTQQVVVDFLHAQGYFVVDKDPDTAARATHAKVVKLAWSPASEARRTAMDLPLAQALIASVERVRGPVIKLPTMGGSVPLEAFERPLGAATIVVPMGNHDSNQHTVDENLRIQNLWDAIETAAALLTM